MNDDPLHEQLAMKKIDAHQHFWNFDPVRDNWITDNMKVIRKDFLPVNLKPVLDENEFSGSVVVQADQSETQNEFLLAHAQKNDFIKGVVGWVDLQADNIEERLEYYSQYKIIKGFRHVLQGETERDLMLKPAFLNGISLLSKYDFTYDILIFPDQLKFIPTLAAAFPVQKFVIDHIAKPNIKAGEIAQWKKDMEAIVQYENVYCKVSGMVTEANWKAWKQADFAPYLDVVAKSFGEDRIMFGSDWPVCLVAASYSQMLSITANYFTSFSTEVEQKFYTLNAVRFYNL